MTRQFTRVRPGRSVDYEAKLECLAGGPFEPFDELRMFQQIYSVGAEGDRFASEIAVLKPFNDTVPVIDGVRIITNEIGRRLGSRGVTPLIRILRDVKTALHDTSPDLDFLRYLGSAIATAESETRRFRSLVVADEANLRSAGVTASNADKNGMVLLWDTGDAYVS